MEYMQYKKLKVFVLFGLKKRKLKREYYYFLHPTRVQGMKKSVLLFPESHCGRKTGNRYRRKHGKISV